MSKEREKVNMQELTEQRVKLRRVISHEDTQSKDASIEGEKQSRIVLSLMEMRVRRSTE